jgi:hypothetical protein
MLLLACSSTEPAPEGLRLIIDPVRVPGAISVPYQGTLMLRPRVLTVSGDTTAIPGAVTFRSRDNSIATVDGAGLVTGVAPGVAMVVATIRIGRQDLADSVLVQVACLTGQLVEVVPESYDLALGESFIPTARLSVCAPWHRVSAPPDVVWRSLDPAILQVDQVTGETVGLKPGVAYVTATDRNWGPLTTGTRVTVR